MENYCLLLLLTYFYSNKTLTLVSDTLYTTMLVRGIAGGIEYRFTVCLRKLKFEDTG